MPETLLLAARGPVLTITLNRPEVKNAMSGRMVGELVAAFGQAASDPAVRVVVLRGAGGTFCAGGDIRDMAAAGAAGGDAMRASNRSFGAMLQAASALPKPVVALVEGAAMGGGLGLACIADWTIADMTATFAMPEVSLGILPAQIAPFVAARIGYTAARRLAIAPLWISGAEALRIGYAHELADTAADLEAKGVAAVNRLLAAAPEAVAATKALLRAAQGQPSGEALSALLDQAADAFVAAVTGTEGREGTRAFVEKRKPAWTDRIDTL